MVGTSRPGARYIPEGTAPGHSSATATTPSCEAGKPTAAAGGCPLRYISSPGSRRADHQLVLVSGSSYSAAHVSAMSALTCAAGEELPLTRNHLPPGGVVGTSRPGARYIPEGTAPGHSSASRPRMRGWADERPGAVPSVSRVATRRTTPAGQMVSGQWQFPSAAHVSALIALMRERRGRLGPRRSRSRAKSPLTCAAA